MPFIYLFLTKGDYWNPFQQGNIVNFSIRDGIKPKYGDNHTTVLWSALLGWPRDGRVILGCCWLRLWSRSSPDQALAPPSTELSLPLAQVAS